MDHIFNSRIARMSRRRACVVYQINAIGRRGPTAFLSQQGQPSFLPSFLQKTCSTIQTLNRAVSQFLRCFAIVNGNLVMNFQDKVMISRNKNEHCFPKRGGSVCVCVCVWGVCVCVKGRLEFFRKFIQIC